MIDLTATDETGLLRAFKWLTRTGAGCHYGSRPIGWYQAHQCHALDVIREHCERSRLDPRCVKVVQGRYRAPFLEGRGVGWSELSLTTRDVYAEADRRSRK